jgi:hypothetical protein
LKWRNLPFPILGKNNSIVSNAWKKSTSGTSMFRKIQLQSFYGQMFNDGYGRADYEKL